MSNDLLSKQSYLRENVLEKGYDADEFMSFLQTIKGDNGLDLNNWEMEELITVVNDFIKSKNKKNIPDQEQEQEQEQEQSEEKNYDNQITINTPLTNHININNNYNISINNIESGVCKCLKSEITSFSNAGNIKVKLSSPKKVEGKMFQKAFISYVVTTNPFNLETNKRYSDFAWLKKVLSLIYVNCVVPPLCKKNFSDRFTEYLIEKRMRSIEKFMNGILEHPIMKNSEVIRDFLSVTNTREYNKKVEKYNKIKKPPTSVNQIKTLSGQIDIGINNEKEIYFDNILNYTKGNYVLLQKITKGYKSLMNIMQQLSNKMKDISRLWKQVLDKSIKYSDSHNTSETFNIMSKFMDDWSEIQKAQMKVINENIREYFRYVKNEFNGLKEMTERVQNAKSSYVKLNEKLLKTKEMLFEKQDAEMWQLREEDKQNFLTLLKNKDLAFSKMLPTETLKLKESKQFYGSLLNSLISEFERIRKINAKRHKDNTKIFVKELSNELTNLHISLADRISEFNELRDDNDIISNKSQNELVNKIQLIQEKQDENDNNDNNYINDDIEEENEKDENVDYNENNNKIKEKNSENKINDKPIIKEQKQSYSDNNLNKKIKINIIKEEVKEEIKNENKDNKDLKKQENNNIDIKIEKKEEIIEEKKEEKKENENKEENKSDITNNQENKNEKIDENEIKINNIVENKEEVKKEEKVDEKKEENLNNNNEEPKK